MDEQELERVVIDFSDGLYDVLACTTIIESGIDMPSVNTLVVERSDLLGLGQLHQIRGRVGRAGQRAYAYLFYPRDTSLTEEAYERLRTIGEHTELGSGFKIAMRDLQIRGAGNLLGGTQSGHIAAVGYDLYVQMVTEAVSELKGEPIRQPAEIKLELPVDANLPRDYIDRDDLRLDAYRRLATVESSAQVDDIADEWTDRFGPIPAAAQSLLDVARLRAECVRTGVTEVSVVREIARISPIRLAASKEIRLKRLFPKAIYKAEPRQLQLPVKTDRAMVLALRDFLADMLPDEPDPGK
jgi:transcription-repair coupling factor (superfamily II helicase)